MVQIADRLVDYNENFQLYLFSNSADLTLSYDRSVLLTIVNFTLNHIGLTEQVFINFFLYKSSIIISTKIRFDLAPTACTQSAKSEIRLDAFGTITHGRRV